MIGAAIDEAENHADDEDVMEGSTRGNEPEFPVGIEDHADGDKPLYPGAPVSKGESLLMLMSYVLRNNLTGKALTHLLKLFNLMFPGLIPPSHSIQSFVEELYFSNRKTENYEMLNENVRGFGHPPVQTIIKMSYRLVWKSKQLLLVLQPFFGRWTCVSQSKL